MNKKIVTLLFLSVFVLAQFGAAAAAPVTASGSIAPLPVFTGAYAQVDIQWTLAGLPGDETTQNVLLWHRRAGFPWSAAYCIDLPGNLNGMTDANGTFSFDTWNFNPGYYPYWDQDVIEFLITVVNNGDCSLGENLPTDEAPMASTFMDTRWPSYIIANPPSLQPTYFSNLSVACNTFELWGIGSDNAIFEPSPQAPLGYSGFEGWHPTTIGTFAPPAPLGPTYDLLSWMITFPSTASGQWTFKVEPEDFAGNQAGPDYFRNSKPIDDGTSWSDELADCATYPDISGNMYEVYIRYMTQLDLAHGYLNTGGFLPDGSLARAEMAAFIEMANGYTGETIPTAPLSAACTFSDVSASDWFAGWVWQACEDGFMVGVGGGLFDPNNFLTRGQVVTVLDNINLFPIPPRGGYFATPDSIFNDKWGNLYRETAWADVNIGDFFANGVVHSYGVGVADGTDETHFSPNQAITRGEFMKMMYRALSRVLQKCDCKAVSGAACCD
jgi:hypothetical protein